MMRRKTVYDKNREKSKTNSSSDNKEKKIIKTQSEIEKELNIRSYSEYRVKDDDSMYEYEDEDIEDKMIRLVILKKKGLNIKENLNLIKKKIIKKEPPPSKLPEIKQALSILEHIDIQKKIRNFFRKLKAKSISVHLKKIIVIFIQKLKKYIIKVHLKNVYNNIILYFNKYISFKETQNKSPKNILVVTPQISKKKKKILKINNSKNIRFELMTKKNAMPKKGGVEQLLAKIEKEQKMEKLKQETNIENMNIINEKIKKLDNLKKKEMEYLKKINERKKKIQNEINLFRKKTNISDEGISQIKQKNNNQFINDSSFFSSQSPSELDSNLKENTNKDQGLFSTVLSNKDNESNNSNKTKIIKIKDKSKEINEEDLYSNKSVQSKISLKSKKENNEEWTRKSVKNLIHKKNLDTIEKKNFRVSVKLTDLNFLKKNSNNNTNTKNNKEVSNFNLTNSPKKKEKEENISISEESGKLENEENEKNLEIEEVEENEENEEMKKMKKMKEKILKKKLVMIIL